MNLRELSKTLGLSQTTVSRALNGYPEVREETRRRVLEAARQHNYRPNARAKGLATGRAMAIGHVIPMTAQHEMVNPIFGDFIAGAGEVYERANYDMVLSVVRDKNEVRAYQDMAAKGIVDGVIIHGPRLDDPRPGVLTSLNMPFVVHGRMPGWTKPYNWVDVNNRRAFLRAATFLIDLGHVRIGLINGLENMDFAIRRRAGYEMALDAAGLRPDPALMAAGEMTELLGYANAQRMLKLRHPPTAFMCSSILPAVGVRRALDEAGLVMGRDVSILIHDDMLSYMDMGRGGGMPVFTSARSSVRDAGRRCAEILIAQIDAPDAPPQTVLWDAELTIGQSTGRARVFI